VRSSSGLIWASIGVDSAIFWLPRLRRVGVSDAYVFLPLFWWSRQDMARASALPPHPPPKNQNPFSLFPTTTTEARPPSAPKTKRLSIQFCQSTGYLYWLIDYVMEYSIELIELIDLASILSIQQSSWNVSQPDFVPSREVAPIKENSDFGPGGFESSGPLPG
jgi:hypothetical protein